MKAVGQKGERPDFPRPVFPSPARVKDMVSGNSQLPIGILNMRYDRKKLNGSKKQEDGGLRSWMG